MFEHVNFDELIDGQGSDQ